MNESYKEGSESVRGRMVGTITTMSEQQQEYEEQPTIISKKLNRISIERIKRLGKHWEETFGVLKA